MWGKGKRESIPNLEVGYKFFPLARVGREEEGMGDFGSHQSAPVNTSEPENNHPTSQYGGKFLMFHRSGQMCLVAAPWQVGRFSGGGGRRGRGVVEGGGRGRSRVLPGFWTHSWRAFWSLRTWRGLLAIPTRAIISRNSSSPASHSC